MAETPQQIVERELREFKRFTGDGLPDEPVGAPLPTGDPQSGVWNPKKVNLRQALLSVLTGWQEQADRAENQADYAEEWAQSDDPISVDAGGNGSTDRSSKWHADRSEDAQAASEDARDIAAGYASDAVSQGNVPIYATIDGMSAIVVPTGINAIRVNGDTAAGDGKGGLFVKRAIEPVTPFKFQSSGGEWWERSFQGAPIVLLASGQSNMALRPSYNWDVPANLAIWNWSQFTHDELEVGGPFQYPADDVISPSVSAGAELARRHPENPVYVINISRTAQPIESWLPGASYDVMGTLEVNVSAALAEIGVDAVDAMLWWQGEANATTAGAAAYPANFQAVQDQLRTNSWFPFATPIVISALSPYYSAAHPVMNTALMRTAVDDPATRTFVDSAIFPQTYWDPADTYIHANGLGAYSIGILMASALEMPNAQSKGEYQDQVTGEKVLRLTSDTRLDFTVQNDGDAANSSAGFKAISDAGTVFLRAFSAAGGGFALFHWDAPGQIRIMASDADGEIAFMTGGAMSRMVLAKNGALLKRQFSDSVNRIVIDEESNLRMRPYTVAELASVTPYPGQIAYVSDGSGGKRMAVANGSGWLYPDGTAVN